MIDRAHDLPITKQAAALNISRGSVYYLPRPVSAADLALMRRIDELHLEFPFAGSRLLRDLLATEGSRSGRRHVTTLMKRMGIEALYRRPRTTKSEPGHKIYPYLLRGMAITRPNQIWAMDITYIPMARGFVYLAVVLDWFSRPIKPTSTNRHSAWQPNPGRCSTYRCGNSVQTTGASSLSSRETPRWHNFITIANLCGARSPIPLASAHVRTWSIIACPLRAKCLSGEKLNQVNRL
jgi:hypothetical protein